ncbi:NAD(+)/NADH kinase [bacterium]|nr:NAD(+)/NADH kinase [bacterium]
MNTFIMRANPCKPEAVKAVPEITEYIVARGGVVVPENEMAGCVIAIGGDGTTMRCLSAFSPRGIPCVGINAGHVGFLTVGDLEHWKEIVDRLLGDDFVLESRTGLCLVYRGVEYGPHVNDVVVQSARWPGKHSGTAWFRISIGGHDIVRSVQADGIIVAAPTGSTAYLLAAGGPIIEPTLGAVAIKTICANVQGSAPYVAGAGREIVITVLESSDENGTLCLDADGIPFEGVRVGEQIVIRKHDHPALLITFGTPEYWRVLGEKKRFARD